MHRLRASSTRSPTLRLRVAGLFFALGILGACAPAGGPRRHPGNAAQVIAGERIYREGIDPLGHPIQAISQSDVPLLGSHAACVSCHRPSGLGSAEGGYYVPPINAPILFAPRKLDRRRLYPQFFYQVQPDGFTNRLDQPRMRPAYTKATLAQALREGVDPAGHRLAGIMPRYRLTNRDIAALAAYLHTLSSHIDPGVDARDIQFATVFSDNIEPAERKAILGTMRAYVEWHNMFLGKNLARPGFSPYGGSQFLPVDRRWALSVWTLTGEDSTWRAQLDARYQKHPVFALIGGKVDGSWYGPARFCDAHRLPCLFPNTALPAWPIGPYSYTVYFSAGLILQARVAAQYADNLARQGYDVVQIVGSDAFGRVPGKQFEHAFEASGYTMKHPAIVYHNSKQLAAALSAYARYDNRVLVFWPGADVRSAIQVLVKAKLPSAGLIVLPSRAIPAARALVRGPLVTRLRFVDPYELDPGRHPKSYETRGWLHARGLGTDHIRLRFKTYYVMSLLDGAMFEMSNDLYRDYLLERLEDESQKDLNPGMYPRLSIGPGERIAVKAAEVVKFGSDHKKALVSASNWIVPGG